MIAFMSYAADGRLRATPGLFAADADADADAVDDTDETSSAAMPDPGTMPGPGTRPGPGTAAAAGEQSEPAAPLLLAQKLTRNFERVTSQTRARSPLAAAAGALVALALVAASVASLMTGETTLGLGSADYFDRSLVDGIDADTSQRELY